MDIGGRIQVCATCLVTQCTLAPCTQGKNRGTAISEDATFGFVDTLYIKLGENEVFRKLAEVSTMGYVLHFLMKGYDVGIFFRRAEVGILHFVSLWTVMPNSKLIDM